VRTPDLNSSGAKGLGMYPSAASPSRLPESAASPELVIRTIGVWLACWPPLPARSSPALALTAGMN